MKDILVRDISEENRSLILLLTSFTISRPNLGFGLPFMYDEEVVRIQAPGLGPDFYEPVYLKMVNREIVCWCTLMDNHPKDGPALVVDGKTLWGRRYSSWAEFKTYELEP
jgi:hypothetical protein